MRSRTKMWSFKLSPEEERRWSEIHPPAFSPRGSKISAVIRLALNELHNQQVKAGRIDPGRAGDGQLSDHQAGAAELPRGTATDETGKNLQLGDESAAELAKRNTDQLVEVLARVHQEPEVKKKLPKRGRKSNEDAGRVDEAREELYVDRPDDAHKRNFMSMQEKEVRDWCRKHEWTLLRVERVLDAMRLEKQRLRTADKRQTKAPPARSRPPAKRQTAKPGKNGRPKKGKV